MPLGSSMVVKPARSVQVKPKFWALEPEPVV
jgi:hypothetical protein